MKAVSVVSFILDIDCLAMGDVRGQLLGDQYKGRIWPTVPGRGHCPGNVVRGRRGEGKAAGASGTCEGCNCKESAPRRIHGRKHGSCEGHDCALRSAICASSVRDLIQC